MFTYGVKTIAMNPVCSWLFTSGLIVFGFITTAAALGPVRYVNPRWGAGMDRLVHGKNLAGHQPQQPGLHSVGDMCPEIALPRPMAIWAPQTHTGFWFYNNLDPTFQGFRCTHEAHPWAGDYGQFTCPYYELRLPRVLKICESIVITSIRSMMMTLEADARRNSSGYYTQEFRALSLARHEASGLNAAAFCRQERINSKTFSRWRKQARRQSSPGLVLAPVTVRQDGPSQLSTNAGVSPCIVSSVLSGLGYLLLF